MMKMIQLRKLQLQSVNFMSHNDFYSQNATDFLLFLSRLMVYIMNMLRVSACLCCLCRLTTKDRSDSSRRKDAMSKISIDWNENIKTDINFIETFQLTFHFLIKTVWQQVLCAILKISFLGE